MLIVIVFIKLKHMTSLHCECFRRKKLERGDHERRGAGSCLCQRPGGGGGSGARASGLPVRADEGELLQLRARHLPSRQGSAVGGICARDAPTEAAGARGRRLGPHSALFSAGAGPWPRTAQAPSKCGWTCLSHTDLRRVSLGGLNSRDTSVAL